MLRGRRWLVTLTLVALASTSPARIAAQATARIRPGQGGVLDYALGERAAARRIVIEARARLLMAIDGARDDALGPADDTLLEQAIARYDVVVRVFPRDVDAWLERGLALARFQRTMPDGSTARRIDEAVQSLEHARALGAAEEEGCVAFELGVLRAAQHDYAGAADEYARALAAESLDPTLVEYPISHSEWLFAVLFSSAPVTTIMGNWAEALMLSGDLSGAIALYRDAHAAAPTSGIGGALALWGLALAEERAGSHRDALHDAGLAIDAGASITMEHGVFAPLHAPIVGFDPPCEIHAYEAIGHEALASRASSDEARASELEAALRSTRYFLAEGGRESRYAATAESAEARLSAAISARP
jgi:tetratricopeptide (TPR) repeat protein